MYDTKNYREQGGEKLVIGGTLEVASGATLDVKSGATVTGITAQVPVATSSTLGGVKVGSGLSVTGEGVLSVPNAGGEGVYGLVKIQGEEGNPIYINQETGCIDVVKFDNIANATSTDIVSKFNQLLEALYEIGYMAGEMPT